jgi:hypothetical protein
MVALSGMAAADCLAAELGMPGPSN